MRMKFTSHQNEDDLMFEGLNTASKGFYSKSQVNNFFQPSTSKGFNSQNDLPKPSNTVNDFFNAKPSIKYDTYLDNLKNKLEDPSNYLFNATGSNFNNYLRREKEELKKSNLDYTENQRNKANNSNSYHIDKDRKDKKHSVVEEDSNDILSYSKTSKVSIQEQLNSHKIPEIKFASKASINESKNWEVSQGDDYNLKLSQPAFTEINQSSSNINMDTYKNDYKSHTINSNTKKNSEKTIKPDIPKSTELKASNEKPIQQAKVETKSKQELLDDEFDF